MRNPQEYVWSSILPQRKIKVKGARGNARFKLAKKSTDNGSKVEPHGADPLPPSSMCSEDR
jgi:hypothetical protein